MQMPGSHPSEAIWATTCKGLEFIAELPGRFVASELPAGYRPSGLAATSAEEGLNNPHLYVVHCHVVHIGPLVVEEEVRLAYTGTLLSDGSMYRWETFLDEPSPGAMLATFRAHGWNASKADIALTTTTIHVAATNVTLDAASAVPAGGLAGNVLDTFYVQYLGPDKVRHMLKETSSSSTTLLYPGHLLAHGGAWSRLAANVGLPQIPGMVNDVAGDIDFAFEPDVDIS
jgi:hypothetical protein